jgi:hypothetical protein
MKASIEMNQIGLFAEDSVAISVVPEGKRDQEDGTHRQGGGIDEI